MPWSRSVSMKSGAFTESSSKGRSSALPWSCRRRNRSPCVIPRGLIKGLVVNPPHHASLQRAAILLVAALTLSGCGVVGNATSPKTSLATTIPTSSLSPTSLCPSRSDFLTQGANGDLGGCFRIPDLRSKSLVVSVQTVVNHGSNSSESPTWATGTIDGADRLTLVSQKPEVKPGERVDVIGRIASPLTNIPSSESSYATLCWDGCQSGLQEQGVPVHWSTRTTFHAVLTVPSTAWLTTRNGKVMVHPLVAGTYSVGVQCLLATSGCALGPADAITSVHLNAPTPSRCVAHRSCLSLRLSTSRGAVGDVVEVSGWAPLETIIGQPFGYDLSVASASGTKRYPELSVTSTAKGSGYDDVVLSPRVLKVVPERTWSALGRITYRSSAWSGLSPITPVGNSSTIAWCSPSGLVMANGRRISHVPNSGVAAAIRGAGLGVLPGISTPTCSTVLVDPLNHRSIFAGFGAEVGGSIPPEYLAGMYTTDGGSSWKLVPTPSGLSPQDFSLFTTSGHRVEAVFFDPTSQSTSPIPLGSDQGLVSTEETVNGGLTWTSSTLSCPSHGPCVSFGPFLLGNCAMNGTDQALMFQSAPSANKTKHQWLEIAFEGTFNNCFTQQLVVTSANGLLLLDPSSQYEFLQSDDAGRTWSNRSIPAFPGQGVQPTFGDDLVFAPDGDLLAMVTSPTGAKQELFLLAPHQSSWCEVPKVFGTTTSSGTVESLRVAGSSLIWDQTRYNGSATPPSELDVVPLTKITC